MTDHLSLATINALADGELPADQLAIANEHLALCSPCTSTALAQTLLKTTLAKAGRRYAMPPGLGERLKLMASQEAAQASARLPIPRPVRPFAVAGWAVAALLLVISSGMMFVQHRGRRSETASVEHRAQITEVSDLHISTLAAGLAPQVVSSDRHTVKPWFQGKLPFSFNLPEKLPTDTKLDGANLTYLQNRPVAQLLYSIGHHHVSIFLAERRSEDAAGESQADHSGFRVISAAAGDLDIVAISDVDPVRLSELVGAIQAVQTAIH